MRTSCVSILDVEGEPQRAVDFDTSPQIEMADGLAVE